MNGESNAGGWVGGLIESESETRCFRRDSAVTAWRTFGAATSSLVWCTFRGARQRAMR